MADDAAEVSVVGPGTRIEGKVAAAGSLRVEGEVTGAITAHGDVTLSAEGRVRADIRARSITLGGQVDGDLTAVSVVSLPEGSRLNGNIKARDVAVGGAVHGNITAEGRVELRTRAQVHGDITSETLVIAEGATFSGRSIMAEERARAAARRATD